MGGARADERAPRPKERAPRPSARSIAMSDPRILQGYVEALAGTIGERNVFRPRGLAEAAEHIAREWQGQGHAVRRQGWDVQGIPCENLEVERPGRVRPQEIILVGAHYDSVAGSPGANDNASGTAALLALGEHLARVSLARTVRLVAFANEEPPFFGTSAMGSAISARAARARGDDIRLMLSLETLGYYRDEAGSQRLPPLFGLCYPDRANFVAFVGNLGTRALVRRAAAAFRAHSDVPAEHLAMPPVLPGLAWSDHRSFWRAGYRALMVTDTAFYRYPHYHLPSDTPEKLAYDVLARVVSGLWGVVTELAGRQ
jgi:hypothetical protein